MKGAIVFPYPLKHQRNQKYQFLNKILTERECNDSTNFYIIANSPRKKASNAKERELNKDKECFLKRDPTVLKFYDKKHQLIAIYHGGVYFKNKKTSAVSQY